MYEGLPLELGGTSYYGRYGQHTWRRGLIETATASLQPSASSNCFDLVYNASVPTQYIPWFLELQLYASRLSRTIIRHPRARVRWNFSSSLLPIRDNAHDMSPRDESADLRCLWHVPLRMCGLHVGHVCCGIIRPMVSSPPTLVLARVDKALLRSPYAEFVRGLADDCTQYHAERLIL